MRHPQPKLVVTDHREVLQAGRLPATIHGRQSASRHRLAVRVVDQRPAAALAPLAVQAAEQHQAVVRLDPLNPHLAPAKQQPHPWREVQQLRPCCHRRPASSSAGSPVDAEAGQTREASVSGAARRVFRT